MNAPMWPPKDWGLDVLLKRYTGLALRPSNVAGVLIIGGDLEFDAVGPCGSGSANASFQIELRVGPAFPRDAPQVRELGGQIPRGFHTNPHDGTLCLGSPLRLAVLHSRHDDLLGFVEACVVPFLFGWVRYKRDGHLPFGELAHGTRGLLDEYREVFRVHEDRACIEMLRMLALKKRIANKLRCPCGSGLRVGRCCHRRLQYLRVIRPRSWFRKEYHQLCDDQSVARI
jgi:hypothetical protein